jgi:hypothetical protein
MKPGSDRRKLQSGDYQLDEIGGVGLAVCEGSSFDGRYIYIIKLPG